MFSVLNRTRMGAKNELDSRSALGFGCCRSNGGRVWSESGQPEGRNRRVQQAIHRAASEYGYRGNLRHVGGGWRELDARRSAADRKEGDCGVGRKYSFADEGI